MLTEQDVVIIKLCLANQIELYSKLLKSQPAYHSAYKTALVITKDVQKNFTTLYPDRDD